MKIIKTVAAMTFAGILISCDSGDSSNSTSLNVTIDGASHTFSCNRNSTTSVEYHVSCNLGSSKRLDITKAYDLNAGEVIVKLTDVPDSSLFDSPYGIEYQCGSLSSDCNTPTVPQYDAATTTISASNVVLPETYNRTSEFGSYVAGVGVHTISFSVNAESVDYFQ